MKTAKCPKSLEHAKVNGMQEAILKKVGVPAQRLHLTAFNDVSSKLLTICGLLQTSSEQELTESILELNSVKITYDEQTNKLIDIDVIDI